MCLTRNNIVALSTFISHPLSINCSIKGKWFVESYETGFAGTNVFCIQVCELIVPLAVD